ncbi:MAG: hypothetical protein AM324_003985 [Candidatus Thorarchaeota archaeon SMTZ1-83]|nr:MAG: hypothetical protein AM324_05100 [Candidatus Thorarchaeota archaeon SMTZ1-83]
MDQEAIRKGARLVETTDPKSKIRLLHVKSDHLLPHTYIIESPSALQILLQPWLVGASLANSARESSKDFLCAAFGIVKEFRNSTIDTVTEVVPLAGALYYSLAEAFEAVFGETINRCFIGAKRHLSESGWMTDLSYLNFEAMTAQPLILIGDTIATGGTIESIIQATMNHSSEIRAIVVYSIAGGLKGAVRLKHLADRIQIPVYTFYSNAIFGVEPNGTDMPWLHPGTVVSPEIGNKAEMVYGLDLGRRWCSIWDWGDRSKHPLKHLRELIERCDFELSKVPNKQTRAILERIKNECRTALKSLSRSLSLK